MKKKQTKKLVSPSKHTCKPTLTLRPFVGTSWWIWKPPGLKLSSVVYTMCGWPFSFSGLSFLLLGQPVLVAFLTCNHGLHSLPTVSHHVFLNSQLMSDIVGIYYLDNSAVSRDSKLQVWVREIFQKCFLSCMSSGKVSIPVFHPLDPTSPGQQPHGFQPHSLHPTLI